MPLGINLVFVITFNQMISPLGLNKDEWFICEVKNMTQLLSIIFVLSEVAI